jgi:hypothetical protein
MVWKDHIHVVCEAPVDGKFPFFAVSTLDAKVANRMMALMQAAQLSDRYLRILFDAADTSGTAFGCNANNCRAIKALASIDRTPDRCEINATSRGCAGFCAAIANNDITCPGFCAAISNNDITCPGFCSSHDDRRCPQFCTRHPTDPKCTAPADPVDPCTANPRLCR